MINSNNTNIDLGNSSFDKILQKEFSSIYSANNSSNNIKLSLSKDLFVKELNKIIAKITSVNFSNTNNNIEKPILIGSHKVFDIKYLLDSIPGIDILIKCREIKNLSEIEVIKENIMSNELNLEFIELCKAYDKFSEIIKITNKCKIKIMKEIYYIYVNLFFVDINNKNYSKKENFVNEYIKKNKIYINETEILLELFFRRWRRKFNLFFIMPELLDIIVDIYYKKSPNNVKDIIDEIFYDLINNKICGNCFGINEFVDEWYSIKENQESLFHAINTSNDYLLKNDFLNFIKCT